MKWIAKILRRPSGRFVFFSVLAINFAQSVARGVSSLAVWMVDPVQSPLAVVALNLFVAAFVFVVSYRILRGEFGHVKFLHKLLRVREDFIERASADLAGGPLDNSSAGYPLLAMRLSRGFSEAAVSQEDFFSSYLYQDDPDDPLD